ncbi:hypothetical protein KUL17_36970 [Alteromonas sp. KUL17]|uniref:hypothetical protein n=1 Tax=Alteromonas sp. KUL17 TaxID=2480796 RepID=UPI0010372D3E|nr:hypothetical protein [Alteromonas sp. KUL17]TAP20665.1 hypothetical protein KUL49_18440 [Alteromonas sp. KUL17]GEA04800.1 hypothetical protein KUL17_36970 [Alteromonas sp. KUL17]
MKLDVEIICGRAEPRYLLTSLARTKFKASEIHEIPGSDTFNIDDGVNDIRGKIVGNVLEFWIRYKREEKRYEKAILDFCRENSLTLQFNPSKKS